MYICDITLFYHVSLLIGDTEINQSINQSINHNAKMRIAVLKLFCESVNYSGVFQSICKLWSEYKIAATIK